MKDLEEVKPKEPLDQDEPTVMDVPKLCLSSLTNSIPPNFCWKSPLDVGYIPTKCPDNFWR